MLIIPYEQFLLGKIMARMRTAFCCFLLCSSYLYALKAPIRNKSDLVDPQVARTIKVHTAKVVVADYPLLKRDFPELLSLSYEEIDQWLIDNTAFIAQTQITRGQKRGVNGEIKTEEHIRNAFRPALYGRALVFKAGSGLIDVKGSGARDPSLDSDSNGLLDLYEAVYEYGMEKIVHMIFEHSQSDYETIENYGVISLDFWNKEKLEGREKTSGLLLRQAHKRAGDNWTCMDPQRSLKIELLLRRYGVTSVGAVDHINIQGSVANQVDGDAIVDFCSYSIHRRFDEPIKDFDPQWQNQQVLVDTDSPTFVQPSFVIEKDIFSEKSFVTDTINRFMSYQAQGSKEHYPSIFANEIKARVEKQRQNWSSLQSANQ